MKKYDDASWHYGADNFPNDLPDVAGGTHAGMFFAWLILNDLCSAEHLADFSDEVTALKARKTTPGQHFMNTLDGKLLTDDLNAQGNGFASVYFEMSVGEYISDYESILNKDGVNTYRLPDTWGNFDILAPRIAQRHAAWLADAQQ